MYVFVCLSVCLSVCLGLGLFGAVWQRGAFGNRLAGLGAAVDICRRRQPRDADAAAPITTDAPLPPATAAADPVPQLQPESAAAAAPSPPPQPSSPWRLFARSAAPAAAPAAGLLGGSEAELEAAAVAVDGADVPPPDMSFLLYPDADSVPLELVPAFAAEYVRLCNLRAA